MPSLSWTQTLKRNNNTWMGRGDRTAPKSVHARPGASSKCACAIAVVPTRAGARACGHRAAVRAPGGRRALGRTSPSSTTYSLPSARTFPASLAALCEPASTKSAYATVSARMNPFSKSEWITEREAGRAWAERRARAWNQSQAKAMGGRARLSWSRVWRPTVCMCPQSRARRKAERRRAATATAASRACFGPCHTSGRLRGPHARFDGPCLGLGLARGEVGAKLEQRIDLADELLEPSLTLRRGDASRSGGSHHCEGSQVQCGCSQIADADRRLGSQIADWARRSQTQIGDRARR